MTKEIVSILTPCYNHESFVSAFIDSVLGQTNNNWELIIVDDCSSDNSVGIIEKYSDPRIKLIKHTYNNGINAALNSAFEESSGQYISIFASDDIMGPDYIDTVIRSFKKFKGINAFYFDLYCIDYNGNKTDRILKHNKQDKFEILRHLFYKGNCMLSPGLTMDRGVANNLFPLNLALSIYQDYKLNIDIILNYNIKVLDNKDVYYRLPSENSGISFGSERTENLQRLETNIAMNSFLGIDDIYLLNRIFNIKLNSKYSNDRQYISFNLAKLAIKSNDLYKRLWGYNIISQIISSKKGFSNVNNFDGFSYKDFLNLSKDIFNNSTDYLYKHKYLKYKKLYKIQLSLLIVMLAIILCLIV